jgi:hypothetical protein
MPVELLIQDGSPEWYLSTDIWVVPGNDPYGNPTSPVAGQPAYLWAQVHNTGSIDVFGVRVDFYWANPALQVLRSTASFVGSAFADIPYQNSQPVVCLVPWNPVIVNDGHECIVAVANHPSDPLPEPLPDAFNPPAFRQVAQKNLSVLAASKQASSHAITVQGWRRADKAVLVTAEVGGELDETTLKRLGIEDLRPAEEHVVGVGLHERPWYAGEDEPLGPDKLELYVPPGTSAAVYALIRARELEEDQYQLVNIKEQDGDRVLGGLGFIVTPAAKEEPS